MSIFSSSVKPVAFSAQDFVEISFQRLRMPRFNIRLCLREMREGAGRIVEVHHHGENHLQLVL